MKSFRLALGLVALAFWGCSPKTYQTPTASQVQNNNSASIKPSPAGTTQPSPSATATPPPSPTPSPTPVVIDGIPVPNHPLLYGYYFSDGKYGNFRKEVECYTNLYVALARAGYESSTDVTDDVWIPVMRKSVEANANAGKRIYLGMNLAETDPNRVTPVNRVLDLMSPHWNKVDLIELSDEPSWNKGETEAAIRGLRSKIQAKGLSDRPVGVVYTREQLMNEDAIFSQGLDWVGIEAYVDPPGDPNSAVNVNKLKKFLDQAKARVPRDKKIVLVMMAYARNGAWTNMNTLKELQLPTYQKAFEDDRVLAVTMFSYGRGSGTREHPELKPIHTRIGNAIQGTNCPY
ncbi:MAG: hypothetical protein IT289_12125 [Oligoflexia bacterium]|nr:hypothetical protein [Oligoflexia bacterium]